LVQEKIPDSGGLDEPRPQPPEPDDASPSHEAFIALLNRLPWHAHTEEEFYRLGDKSEGEKLRLELELTQLRNNIRDRKKYGLLLFVLIIVWLFLSLMTVWASATKITLPSWWPLWIPTIREFKISDTALVALISTTTANVIGLFIVVVRYMFPASAREKGKRRKSKESPTKANRRARG